MNVAQEQANIQRAEAKRLMNIAFGFDNGISSEAVDRAVDCIISAAMLELVVLQAEAMTHAETSDNPFMN